ncbi:MAG: Chorismate mutase AroH [Gemmatimonadaceae bacterium]|nr:Chorismate mutase AroH [Gemmatimonadaceae bacterium]
MTMTAMPSSSRLAAARRQPAATPRFCALRGATTVAADEGPMVDDAVRELLTALTCANGLRPDDIVSAIFSATPDIHSLYPAAVARALGWTDVPMLCVTEMTTEGAPALCIRVMLHLTLASGRTVRPIYLRGARTLRPDLVSL